MSKKSRFVKYKTIEGFVGGAFAAIGASIAQAASDEVQPGLISKTFGTVLPYMSGVIYPVLERINHGNSYGERFSYRKYFGGMSKVYSVILVLAAGYAPAKFYAMDFCERFSNNAFWTSLGADAVVLPAYLGLTCYVSNKLGFLDEPGSLEQKVA